MKTHQIGVVSCAAPWQNDGFRMKFIVLPWCGRSRGAKVTFFVAEVHPWGAPGGRGGLAKRFKVASPQLSRNPRGFGLPAYGCRGPSRAGMYIRTATPRVPKGAWPPLPGSTPRGSPQFAQHRLRICVPCPAVLTSPRRIPGDSEKDAWARRKGCLGTSERMPGECEASLARVQQGVQ